MNTLIKYLELDAKIDKKQIKDFGKNSNEFYELINFIDTLSNSEKIEIRQHLENNHILAPKSLYYDYKKQIWIRDLEE